MGSWALVFPMNPQLRALRLKTFVVVANPLELSVSVEEFLSNPLQQIIVQRYVTKLTTTGLMAEKFIYKPSFRVGF